METIDEKIEKRVPKHSDDSTRVTIWISKDLLEKWDVYCSVHDNTRTQLIKTSVNEYIRKSGDIPSPNGEIAKLTEKLNDYRDELKAVLGKVVENEVDEEASVNALAIKEKIMLYFERSTLLEVKSFARITGIDARKVLKMLGILSRDKIVEVNSSGEWYKT